MNVSENIIDFLQEHNISFRSLSHKPIFSVEEGAEIAGEAGVGPCKCLLFVNRRHQYYMLLAQGDGDVDLHSIAEQAGSSRLSFASADALESLLHTTAGAVSPLGLIFDGSEHIKFMMDEKLLNSDELLLATCVNDRSVVIATQDFINVFLPASGHPDYLTAKV